jgi:ABC-type lipoprotein export system ATPase subunit
MAFIEVTDLKKTYSSNDNQVEILKGLNLEIGKGEFVSLMGPSGAGKSTFLQLLGALDRPTI